jgi:hypothetical protein
MRKAHFSPISSTAGRKAQFDACSLNANMSGTGLTTLSLTRV